MIHDRGETGRIGEQVAAQFLERKGFKVIDRNFRKPWGEIDIVAEKGDAVRFVEVKTVSRDTSEAFTPSAGQRARRETFDYSPEDMAHASKLQKVARTAELYMESKGDERDFQIDVVTVLLDRHTRKATCKIYEQVL